MHKMTISEALDSFVRRIGGGENGCWEWQGARSYGGYGAYRPPHHLRVAIGCRLTIPAHQMSMLLFTGARAEDGLHTDHLCFNPPCVNPEHLEIVTGGENARRRWARTRQGIGADNRMGSRDFDWLTGGLPLPVWLNRGGTKATRRKTGIRSVDIRAVQSRPSATVGTCLLWDMDDVEALLDELFPDPSSDDIPSGSLQTVVDEPSPEVSLRSAIFYVLNSLPPRDRMVIALRWGLVSRRATLKEVAACLRGHPQTRGETITLERVRQIEAKAIRKLQHPVRRQALKSLTR
ncbi:MAG: hypothetical protein GY820_39330 [Gammaproteobacteria bacterium]|nr:hypothetical protein [Gammaproteobacteria bacterium]